jgi:hypothetical protein
MMPLPVAFVIVGVSAGAFVGRLASLPLDGMWVFSAAAVIGWALVSLGAHTADRSPR